MRANSTSLTPPSRRYAPLGHSLRVCWLLLASLLFMPLYLDGFRSVLLALLRAHLTTGNRQAYSIAAVTIMLPIAYAWKRSPRWGLGVQIGLLVLILSWSAFYDRAVILDWWNVVGLIAIVCCVVGGFVSLILWLLALRHRTDADS